MISFINRIGKEIAYLSFFIFVILYSTCNIFFTAKQENVGYLNNYIYFGINVVHIILVLFLLFIIYKIIRLNLSRKANMEVKERPRYYIESYLEHKNEE